MDLLSASEAALEGIRGASIAMVFQDPMSSLDPVHRVGDQIVEQIRAHDADVSRREAWARAVELLGRVGIPRPAERARSFPHEFSGGMRQRVMIAMALSCSPSLLIADEPTTALDVTIQAQILRQLRELRDATGAAIVIVTHDLGVVADIADRVLVMYAGRVVEQGTLDELFYDPRHPYTWGLLGSIARLDRDRSVRLPAIPGLSPVAARSSARLSFRARAARTPSTAASRRSRSWASATAAVLDLADKRRLRTVRGAFGLAA